MGVKGLWRILEPVKQHKSLGDLRGQIIAVDVSIWIVEAKTVLPMSVSKPHLRNLFFRVIHLLQLGIVPVIVVEGVPPDLKQGVMRKRLKHQGHKGPPGEHPKKIGRTRFQAVHRECCEMLELLGVPFIQAASEAEAMCAFLNSHHIVDGCITNDGDAFLYGARTVYRNFTMNAKDRHVDVYSMDDVESTLGLDRESLVGLAVLLGCDYLPKGVAGVGPEMAQRFISSLNGESILQRFNLWKNGGDGNGIRPASLTEKSGEANICRRALASPGFPYKEVVDEFLVDKDKVPQQQRLVWKRPKIFKLVNYALGRLEWPEEYTMSKILPLLTLFDMDALIRSGLPNSQFLRPFRIVKMRIRQGVSCFEVEWHKIDGDPMTTSEYYTTVEEQEVFRIAFPDVVAAFKDGRQMKGQERKQKPKKLPSPTEPDEIFELTKCFQNLPMLQEPKKKESKQKQSKNPLTCLPSKVSSPQCRRKPIHTGAKEAFDEFDHLVMSSLRKVKSMASINEKSLGRRQKPPRFVISSDSSDDDDCYWLDKSNDTGSLEKNIAPSSSTVIGSENQQKKELMELDNLSGDESDSPLKCYLPLGQRLALQNQGVVNHRLNSKQNSSGFSEKTVLSATDEFTVSRCAEKLACNDNRKISRKLKDVPSKLLDLSDISEDFGKLNLMPDFSLRKSAKNEDSNSLMLCHMPRQKSSANFGNTSDFLKEKTSVDRNASCNIVSDLERKSGRSNESQDVNYYHSKAQLSPGVTSVTKLHNVTPCNPLPTASTWSVGQYGNFGIETSVLNGLDSSYNTTDRESVVPALYKRTALDDSQVDLFDNFSCCATPEWADLLSKTPEAVVSVDLTNSPTMQSTKGGCSVEVLSRVQTPSLATVSLAERLRLKFGDGSKMELLAHLAPTVIQSSVKANNDI